MPKFQRKPTHRLDDDLRRIAEEREWKFVGGGSIIFRDNNEPPMKSTQAPIQVLLANQERILNTGAEDAVVDGLVDFPL